MAKTTFLAAALAFGLMAPSLALADNPGPDWMTKEQLVQKLTAAGYQSIVELEADDGHWEGEAIHNGKIVEFHADPRTGNILSEKVKD